MTTTATEPVTALHVPVTCDDGETRLLLNEPDWAQHLVRHDLDNLPYGTVVEAIHLTNTRRLRYYPADYPQVTYQGRSYLYGMVGDTHVMFQPIKQDTASGIGMVPGAEDYKYYYSSSTRALVIRLSPDSVYPLRKAFESDAYTIDGPAFGGNLYPLRGEVPEDLLAVYRQWVAEETDKVIVQQQERLALLSDAANEMADKQEWCSDFERAVHPLGLAGRKPANTTVTVSVQVSYEFDLAYADAPNAVDSLVRQFAPGMDSYTMTVTGSAIVDVPLTDIPRDNLNEEYLYERIENSDVAEALEAGDHVPSGAAVDITGWQIDGWDVDDDDD